MSNWGNNEPTRSGRETHRSGVHGCQGHAVPVEVVGEVAREPVRRVGIAEQSRIVVRQRPSLPPGPQAQTKDVAQVKHSGVLGEFDSGRRERDVALDPRNLLHLAGGHAVGEDTSEAADGQRARRTGTYSAQ